MSEEHAEGIFEGKEVQIVGKRRSYLKVRDKEEGTEKWVDGKRVSISGGVLPKSLLMDHEHVHVTINDHQIDKPHPLSLGGGTLPDTDDTNVEKKESSDTDSVLSDSQIPLAQRQDTMDLPKRRSVTFSPVVMTRDLDTFGNVSIPTILGSRSERSNSDVGRGWYTLQDDCLVRETAENHSEHLYTLSNGALVHVTKCAQGQAQINSPCAGWISTGLNGSSLKILSQEDIKSRGLDRDVPDMSLSPLSLPDKGISDITVRSTASDIDPGMDDWLTKQLQKVEEDIYGKKLSVSLNSHRTDSSFSTTLPPVPDKFDDSLSSQPNNVARDSTFSTGTVNEDDLNRSGLKLLQNLNSTRSTGPVRLSDFPSNYDSPALAPIGLSMKANASSEDLDQKSLNLSTTPSKPATDKVLDIDPPAQSSSPPTSSLVSLLRDLSSTRKEIQRLQALEQTIVAQVVATFDAIAGVQDDNNDDADLFALLQDTIQTNKKRFPSTSSKKGLLKPRSSETNLLRHGSISKWSQEELDRHEQNLRDQFAMLSPKPSDGKKAISTTLTEYTKNMGWPVSQMKQNQIDKDDLMEQGKNLIMKMAELYNNIDDEPTLQSAESEESTRVGKLQKRNSDYNLFRHGSMDKWSNDELERHKQNLKDQVASLAIKEVRKQKDSPKPVKKMTKIETMIQIRNSDINLFRPTSMNKWDDSEIKRAVDNMQNEMERLHEQMIQNAPTRPKDTDPGDMNASTSLQANLEDVKESAMRELLEDREVTRARCLSYDSSLLFSDSSEIGEDTNPSPNSDITSPSVGVPEPPVEDKRSHESAIQKMEQEFDPEDSANVTSSDAIPPTP